MEHTVQIIAAMLALGMALAFFLADRRGPASRAFAGFLAAVGASIIVSQFECPFLGER